MRIVGGEKLPLESFGSALLKSFATLAENFQPEMMPYQGEKVQYPPLEPESWWSLCWLFRPQALCLELTCCLVVLV